MNVNKFIKHLEKIRRAHNIQLTNIKHKVIDICDQMITSKIVSYQQCVNKEVQRIFKYIENLKKIIEEQSLQMRDNKRLISNYELVMTQQVIK